MSTLPDSPPPGSDRLRAFAKYSGIAFQMLAIIGLSAWLGVWLDGRYATKTPWFTMSLMLFGVLAALYQVIRSLTRES
jgi:ATP synthase protein I